MPIRQANAASGIIRLRIDGRRVVDHQPGEFGLARLERVLAFDQATASLTTQGHS
jgi:hypothetical protein